MNEDFKYALDAVQCLKRLGINDRLEEPCEEGETLGTPWAACEDEDEPPFCPVEFNAEGWRIFPPRWEGDEDEA